MSARRNTRIFVLWILIFLIQNPLRNYLPVIEYADELFPIFGLAVFCSRKRTKLFRTPKAARRYILPFAVFFFACIMGNIIYRYQSVGLVLLDAYTNFKFFGTLIAALIIFERSDYWYDTKKISKVVNSISTILFSLVVIDFLFKVFPADGERFGLRPEQLIYTLPTYLVGAVVFLLSLQLMFFRNNNVKYIIMNLITMSLTLRSKALAAVIVFCIIYWVVQIRKKKFKVWHLVVIGIVGIFIAWSQIRFYYIELSGASARSLLTITSVKIAKDYFPIGTGFASFASHAASMNYSPVYYKYGLNNFWELSNANPSGYFDDTFWPIILGQGGLLGIVSYLFLLVRLFITNIKIRKYNKHLYAMVLFVFSYLLISSTSEPSFNNSIAIPLAMVLGYSWAQLKRVKSVGDIGMSIISQMEPNRRELI